MKHAFPPPRTKRLLLLSATLATLGLQACRWDDSLYERYVGDRDVIEPCKGICLSENIPQDEGECKALGYRWTNKKCIRGDQYLDANNKESCNNQKGTWFDGECKILDKDTCDKIDGEWAVFQLYDIDNGQYIQVKDGKFYCGTYDDIKEQTTSECLNIEKYVQDIGYGLCRATTFCRSVNLNNAMVTACTTCQDPDKNVKCGNTCVNIMTDPEHCGSCENACNQENREFCDNGECKTSCKSSEEDDSTTDKILCEIDNQKICVDIANDPMNCGSCGRNCREEDEEIETWMCKSGQCVAVDTCPNSQIKCYCSHDVDTEEILDCYEEKLENTELVCIHPLSINACGATSCQDRGFNCPIGQTCVQSVDNTYECQCATGFVKKDNKCLNPYNPETCGVTVENMEEDLRCKENEICNGTACVCAQGFEKCDDTEGCVDILSNPKHCGHCTKDCGKNAYCSNGACICNKGFSRCENRGGSIICGDDNIKDCNESRYKEYCGAEGLANDPQPGSPNFKGDACDDESICQKNGNSWECGCNTFVCDKKCIDPDRDLTYCGSTACDNGHNCYLEGHNTECDRGTCKCTGKNLLFVGVLEQDGSISYTTNLDDEGIKRFDCINTQTDPLCCGGKNNCENAQCENNKVCSRGYCEEQCPDGYVNCNGNCLDNTFNVAATSDGHCKCKISQSNTLTCPTNGNPDYGCLIVQGNVNNCGECGKKCDLTYSCIQNKECACTSDTSECLYEAGLYNGNESEIKICMNFNTLHMKDCKQCADNWGNLDKDWSNGCEADLSRNINHCGTEGNDCTSTCNPDDTACTPNVVNAGGIVCQEGKCGYSTCNHKDYMNCDGDIKNEDSGYYFLGNENTTLGCETNIKSDVNHCGMCGYKCVSNKCEEGECCYHNDKNIHLDSDAFKCCEGNTRYEYRHSFWKGCYDSSHYGCSENKLKGDGNLGINCWYKSEH